MIRQAISTVLVVFSIVFVHSPLLAQTPPPVAQEAMAQFTVSVQSAPVRKSPSTGSPSIGQATRGAVLEVTRDIGAWVKVAWADASDGVGYVHQSMGTVSQRPTQAERLATAFAPAPAPEVAPATAGPSVVQSAPRAIPMSTRSMYVAPPTHVFGIGGRIGSNTSAASSSPLDTFGVTARVWSRSRFGIQIDASRMKQDVDPSSARVTTMQIAPSAVFSIADRVSDYVWLRPYAGAGGALLRSTLKHTLPGDPAPASDTTFGFRTFGGSEVTFPAVPRIAFIVDAGYLWSPSPFDGIDVDGLELAVGVQWYVR